MYKETKCSFQKKKKSQMYQKYKCTIKRNVLILSNQTYFYYIYVRDREFTIIKKN